MKYKNYRQAALLLSFAIESTCIQTAFIFFPLATIRDFQNELLASIQRSLAYLGPMLLGYTIGIIIDKFNRTLVSTIAALSCSMAFLFIYITRAFPNFFLLAVPLAILSISSYALNNMRSTIAPLILGKGKLAGFNSYILTIENSSLILSPLLASLLLSLETEDSHYPIYFSFAFILVLILFFYALKETPKFKQRKPTRIIESITFLRSYSKLMDLIYITMGNNAFIGIFTFYITIYSMELGSNSITQAPLVLISLAIGAIVGGLLSARIVHFISRAWVMLLLCASMSLFVITSIIWKDIKIIVLSCIFIGAIEASLVVCVWTIRQQIIPAADLGRITGLTSMLFKVPMFISIPIAGLLVTPHNTAPALIFGCICSMLGCIPLIVKSVSSHKTTT